MAYPYILYIYCVASIDTDVTELLDGFDVEYSYLPSFGDFNKYKIKCDGKGPIQLLSTKLEDLGAFFSESRVVEMEK